MHVGVPGTAISLTGGKSASSVRELPPPYWFAVSDGKKNAASDNSARVPSLGQPVAHPIVEEAKREDTSDGHLPQVDLGASERDNRQKEEEKKALPLGNTDVH